MLDETDWQGESISVVSLGCGQHSVLTLKAILAIENAEIIFGSGHHFDEIAGIQTNARMIAFPSPFSDLAGLIKKTMNHRIVILASGDALFFGPGSFLNREFGNSNLVFYPNISSIQTAFHAIGLPWQDAEIISLHGRPLSSIRRHLVNGKMIAAFTDSLSNPVAIAKELTQQGFGESAVWVCESMGSDDQQVSEYQASELANIDQAFNPLNVCIMLLIGQQPALPVFPGISDHYFSTGAAPGFGMISKREVRLAILSLMQPSTGEIAWDIGAGCGSVSVEWARWNRMGEIYAIEPEAERIQHIETNSDRFGTTQNLTVIKGSAPDCCELLPDPDCIFIGGSNGLLPMLEFAWHRLKPGGKLVASAVTEDSQQSLLAFMSSKKGFEQVEIQVSKNLPDSHEIRTLNPVLLGKCVKDYE